MTIRTSMLSSSATNNFSVGIVGDITTTSLSKDYPAGTYSINSAILDLLVDIYVYNSGGSLVGSSSGLTLTTTGSFNKIVVLGGTKNDVISFIYNQTSFVSVSTSNEVTSAAAISSISPVLVNSQNTTMQIVGSNFATNVEVYFKGSDGVEIAADSLIRNSATSLTITSPDTLPTEYSPYSVIVQNPGVSRPTTSNSHILENAVDASNTTVDWIRPSDWLTLTAPSTNEQKFIGLLAITNDDSNYISLLAQGNYTVDWGDGTTENFTTNTKASHKYTYSSISSSTLTSRGYKQVLVTVTPQSGQNLTSIDLQQTYTRTNLPVTSSIQWLDIAIAGTNLTNIKITSISPTYHQRWLEKINIVSSNLASYSGLFAYCKVLQDISINSNSAITDTSYMFSNCSKLKTVPLFNTSSVINMSGMFSRCTSLKTVPLFNTSSVTNMSSMFHGCISLQTVPLFNTSSVTNMSSMFYINGSLQTVPLFNTSAVTNMSYMFNGCTSLQTVPLFNTSSVTNMSYMFNYCYSLQTVSFSNLSLLSDTSYMFQSCYSVKEVYFPQLTSLTNTGAMFSNCYSLQTVPLFNTSSVTNMNNMFNNCYSLKTVPLFNTSSVTNMSAMFSNCYSLQTVPLFNTSSVTNMGAMFSNCYSLKTVPLFNTSSVTNMSNMFYGCYSLQTVPLFNTSAVTNMSYMFGSCTSMQTVPLFNTSSVTTMSSMFNWCYSLQEIPEFNLASLSATGVDSFAVNTILLQSYTIFKNASNITTLGSILYTSTSPGSIASVSILEDSASTPRALKNININCSGVTSAPATSFATVFTNLSSVVLTGMKYAFSILGAKLDGPALNAMYTSLGTASGAQTITVTSNHGTVDDDPTIATVKGWTVTGS